MYILPFRGFAYCLLRQRAVGQSEILCYLSGAATILLLIVWSACGGRPTPVPVAPPLDSVPGTNLTAQYWPETHEVDLSWSNVLPSNTEYTVESSIPGVPNGWKMECEASGDGPSVWCRVAAPNSGSSSYRVRANTSSGNEVLQTVSGATSVLVDLTISATILFDHAEPLAGTTNISVSVSHGGSPVEVQYSVDNQIVGSSTVAPSYPAAWDGSQVVLGTHVAAAAVQFSADFSVLVHRQFQGGVTPIVASITATPDGNSGMVSVVVVVTFSLHPISGVLFAVDGTMGMNVPASSSNRWTWTWDPTASSPGSHQISALIIDVTNVQLPVATTFLLDKPVLTIDQPLSGDLVGSTLNVSGTFSDTLPVTVAVMVGQNQVASAATSPFQIGCDLSALTEGRYVAQIVASNSAGFRTVISRTIIYAVAAAQEYVRVASGDLTDADNGVLLYKTNDVDSYLQQPDGSRVVIPINGQGCGAHPLLSANQVAYLQSEMVPDLDNMIDCIPLGWDLWANGEVTSLGLSVVAMKGDWILGDVGSRPALMNIQTNTIQLLMNPPESYFGAGDFYISGPDDITAFVSVSGQYPASDFYSYSTNTQTWTQITNGGLNSSFSTDGINDVWLTSNGGGSSHVVIVPYSQPTLQTEYGNNPNRVGTTAGVAAWEDRLTDGSKAIMVRTPAGTVEQVNPTADTAPISLLSIRNGGVLWQTCNATYEWTPTSGTIKILPVTALSGVVDVSGPVLVITDGTENVCNPPGNRIIYVHR